MTKKEKENKEKENQESSTNKPEETAEEVLLLSKAEVDEMKQSLEEAKKKEQENLEAWQRERADFINYKKRIDREQETNGLNFKADIMKKYLAVLDDMELAMRNQPKTDEEVPGWVKGIELILRKFDTINQNEGLEKIETENMAFDPNFHQAISYEDSDEVDSGNIIDKVQNGYKLGDRVIRPALVRVAK